ncbi:MAG TPA: M28 family peptidase [Candidatus Kapabacteria bacterium]|nr:M28 family peptidase [Candidatus Kapabacteria bacterium]
MNNQDIDVLKHFLEYPIWTSKPIFDKFKTIQNAIFREHNAKGKERFLFVNGTKESKVVLVAHADTVFDEFYKYSPQKHSVEIENDCFIGKNQNGGRIALGADDRAGCAILWALKDSGHSILITDGEEKGSIGSHWLIEQNPDIANIINQHQFMIQFDRQSSSDFKCYDVGTKEFRTFIKENTNYSEPNRSSYTDICTLCKEICGVNLSVGYYDEHTSYERINFNEWLHTLNVARKLLDEDLPKFER